MMIPLRLKTVYFFSATLYSLLVGLSPFSVFHHHGVVFDASGAREISCGLEFHDASCPSHTNAHLHLFDHCFTCKYFSDKISLPQSHFYLFENISSESLFQYSNPSFLNIFHSPFSGRAPPTFFA
jgi:hypothetical protein